MEGWTRSQPQSQKRYGFSTQSVWGANESSREILGCCTPRSSWVDFLLNAISLMSFEIFTCHFFNSFHPCSHRGPASVFLINVFDKIQIDSQLEKFKFSTFIKRIILDIIKIFILNIKQTIICLKSTKFTSIQSRKKR